MWVLACEGQRITSAIVPHMPSTLVFDTDSVIGLEFTKATWPMSPGDHLSLPPQPWDHLNATRSTRSDFLSVDSGGLNAGFHAPIKHFADQATISAPNCEPLLGGSTSKRIIVIVSKLRSLALRASPWGCLMKRELDFFPG